MKVEADGFIIDFTDALVAFVFDEKDKTKPTYHGQPMKAVDIVAEFAEAYVFVEIKDFDNPDMYDTALAEDDDDLRKKRDHFKWLKNYLKYKYRDTYLYRHAENKVDKPIHYICLMTFENAVNLALQKSLKRELPVGRRSRRWKREIVKSCQVLNIEQWNRNFPKWRLRKAT